jgi:hypothetical protein
MFEPPNLPGSRNHAKRWLDRRRRFEAGKATEILKLLCLDELIIVRVRRWPMNADQNFGSLSAANTIRNQPARATVR